MSMGVSFQKITQLTAFRKPVSTIYHKFQDGWDWIPTRTVFDSFGSDMFLSIERFVRLLWITHADNRVIPRRHLVFPALQAPDF